MTPCFITKPFSRYNSILSWRNIYKWNIFLYQAQANNKTLPLNYFAVFKAVQANIPKDSIIVSEGANTMDIGRGMLLNNKPRHRLDAGTFGTMGVSWNLFWEIQIFLQVYCIIKMLLNSKSISVIVAPNKTNFIKVTVVVLFEMAAKPSKGAQFFWEKALPKKGSVGNLPQVCSI